MNIFSCCSRGGGDDAGRAARQPKRQGTNQELFLWGRKQSWKKKKKSFYLSNTQRLSHSLSPPVEGNWEGLGVGNCSEKRQVRMKRKTEKAVTRQNTQRPNMSHHSYISSQTRDTNIHRWNQTINNLLMAKNGGSFTAISQTWGSVIRTNNQRRKKKNSLWGSEPVGTWITISVRCF